MPTNDKPITAEIIKNGLSLKIRDCESEENEVSWGMQEGILISKGDAKNILRLIEYADADKIYYQSLLSKAAEGLPSDSEIVKELKQENERFKAAAKTWESFLEWADQECPLSHPENGVPYSASDLFELYLQQTTKTEKK